MTFLKFIQNHILLPFEDYKLSVMKVFQMLSMLESQCLTEKVCRYAMNLQMLQLISL